MTEKGDPSRVGFGWDGQERRRPLQKSSSGNGANGNGTLAEGERAFRDSARAAPGFSELGRLILDTLDRGVIALDITGTIIDANRDARRLMDAAESLRAHNGRLEFLNACLDKQLHQLLATLSLTPSVAHGFVARLNRPNNDQPLRVLVAPLGRGITQIPIAVLVYIFDTRPERVISNEVLRDIYGLTNAQAAVTACLFEGHSVEHAAELLGLSVNTVRSHLKQIFIKCEVHSQGALLCLLSRGPCSV